MANAFELNIDTNQTLQQPSLLALRSLQDAAAKLADLKNTPYSLSTKSLINLLICQAQRNKRMSMPTVRIHLLVGARPNGPILKLRLGATNI